MSHQKPRFTAFFDLPNGLTLTAIPRDVSREIAERQVHDFMAFLQPFPGGTQSVRGYVDATS